MSMIASLWRRQLSGLSVAVLLVGSVGGAAADTVSDLTALLLKNEPKVPDGTADETLTFGNTIHVVNHDNMDSWKIQVSVRSHSSKTSATRLRRRCQPVLCTWS